MSFKDYFIFNVIPAPSEENDSKIEWRGFLDPVSQDIVIFDDATNTILFRIPGGGNTLSVTYAELLALKNASEIIPGKQYLITDFRTQYIIPNTAVISTGAIEPIIVTGASTNSIAPEAISIVFPKDQILYELEDSTTSGADRGRIYSRLDTLKKVGAGYNWRVIKFRRWDDGFGNFTITIDNGNAFQDFYTFNNSATALDCVTTVIGPITEFGIATFGAPTSKLNNFIIIAVCVDNVIDNDTFDNTIITTTFGANKIGPAFLQNTALGGEFVNNTISPACVGNTMGSDFTNNSTGIQFFGNTIGDGFAENIINVVFFGNTVGNGFQTNIISSAFAINIIGDDFEKNTVGAEFQGNNIGNNFSVNTLGPKFQNNIIANDFTNNTIGAAFDSNINITDGFTMNTIANALNGVDFVAANLVYNNYSKNIFKNSAGSYRLSYVDGADTVQYAAPNA